MTSVNTDSIQIPFFLLLDQLLGGHTIQQIDKHHNATEQMRLCTPDPNVRLTGPTLNFRDSKLVCLSLLGASTVTKYLGAGREYYRGKFHCTVDLLFDWFGLLCFANKNKICQLSYSFF